jgi:hypothetical protein
MERGCQLINNFERKICDIMKLKSTPKFKKKNKSAFFNITILKKYKTNFQVLEEQF